MKKKRILILIGIVCIAAVLLVLAFSTGVFGIPDMNAVTVGFINPNSNDTYYSMVESALRAAVEEKNHEFISLDAGGDNSAIYVNAEMLENRHVDVIVTFNDMTRFPSDAADFLAEAGTPFIVLDNPLVGAVYCGFDHSSAGEKLGKQLASSAQKQLGGADLILSLQAAAPGYAQNVRAEAALEALKVKTGINEDYMVSVASAADEKSVTAQLKTIFEDSPSLGKIVIVCENDQYAKAALAAAETLNYSDQVVIGSFSDGMDFAAADNFKAGKNAWVCSVLLPPDDLTQHLSQTVFKAVKDKDLSDCIIDTKLLTH
ncbi:sugar ABC transporter substrate-binding protein [Christensenella tenuis]|jgi:ABC-type sugar transport system substrate-binding protein|uniref:Substrate-binding domain-containing protein n=1 Tax=Christensenella tenuis TaxID=2763033 RepID=A0ABR7EIL3_9FIRM|nr:substrate-binding domain-containing protein [Christensenella tenuis]MBC5648979.1 substrate-binding domain-containing protein [Christensenella tenuis]